MGIVCSSKAWRAPVRKVGNPALNFLDDVDLKGQVLMLWMAHKQASHQVAWLKTS